MPDDLRIMRHDRLHTAPLRRRQNISNIRMILREAIVRRAKPKFDNERA